MAKCKVCGATETEVEFYSSVKTHCKEHWKAKVRENRAANIDYYREFDRQRANLPHRVAAREQYRKTEAFAEAHAKATSKWAASYPDRRSASQAVSNALRAGKLIRHPCFVCGDEKSEAHHPDYSSPLDVVWLCPAHHKQAHAISKRAA